MSQSRLSYKISLCQSIEKLNDSGCFEVIRLLQHKSGCQDLNCFVTTVIMQMTQTMDVEWLTQMDNTVKEMISNDNYTKSKKLCSNDVAKSNTSETIIFPLLQLPRDILHNTSLYLNEKDIFIFEKCCRLFYKMINKLSYLKQSNNFKTMILNDKKFHQITNPQYSFYKYSQSQKLTFAKWYVNSRSKWQEAKEIDKKYDHWLTNLFKSIKSLIFNNLRAIELMVDLPIEILFDSKSHLESMIIDCNCNVYRENGYTDIDYSQSVIDFEKQLVNFKEKYESQGRKSVKKLQYIEYKCDCKLWVREIETKHLSIARVNNMVIQRITTGCLMSSIRVLTIEKYLHVSTMKQFNCNIDTLRLLNFDVNSKPYICNNNNIIESLNLQQSLVNLTLQLYIGFCDEKGNPFKEWIDAIDKILIKEYYHHLKNVNILVDLSPATIKPFFQILKKNCKVFKDQFKQLNIGVKMDSFSSYHYYYTFSCNFNTIDEKFFIEQENQVESTILLLDATRKQHQTKYCQWEKQWC